MRLLCRSVTGIALMAALWFGCGGGGDDSLVLSFIEINGANITQADAVNPNSADVDVVQNLCLTSEGGLPTAEPFTQTAINAVFRNEEKADIRLESYTVDVGPRSGLGVFTGALAALLPGGRCGGTEPSCAVDADCGLIGGACIHSDTTVASILLFNFDAKSRVIPGTYSVVISFVGRDDADRTFVSTTGYEVTFENFDNCPSSGGGAGLS